MKILKRILIIIAVIIAIPLIIALFVSKDYTVRREVIVNKPVATVYEYVKQLKNQDNYNKWVMKDPNMKRDFKGDDGTVGFSYAWDSKEAGEGVQTITSLQENKSVDTKLHFVRPMEGDATTNLLTEAQSDNSTKVTWTMSGRSKYPINFMNLFINKLLGSDLQESLGNLKNNLEK